MKTDFFFIGHRGTRTSFDENTIEAFRKAIEYGSNYIEFDVRKTEDDEYIVFHDSTLDRTTTGSGLISKFKYNAFKEFKSRINNCHIPLLSEVLLELRGKIKFIIELKDEGLKDKIPQLIQEYRLFDDCIISGRILGDLKYIRKKYTRTTVCYNITKGVDLKLNEFLNIKRNKLTFKPDLISLKSTLITTEFIKSCHKNKILSLAWGFLKYQNPINVIKKLIKKGIDGILFDNHKNIPKIKNWINSR